MSPQPCTVAGLLWWVIGVLGWSTSACMESGGKDKETDFWVRRTKYAQMHEKVSVLNEDCIGT